DLIGGAAALVGVLGLQIGFNREAGVAIAVTVSVTLIFTMIGTLFSWVLSAGERIGTTSAVSVAGQAVTLAVFAFREWRERAAR
ncbi:MAG: hypothetical protein KY410_09030, partial [Proteobacteria bacterium]|nr:hypothetical protein [Pseudomonadota bacterium]